MLWIVHVVLAVLVLLASIAYRSVISEPQSYLSYIQDLSLVDPDAAPIALPPRFIPLYGDSLRHQRNMASGRPLAIVQEPASQGAKLSLAFFGREPRLFLHDGRLAARLIGMEMESVGLDPFRKSRFSVMYPKSLITSYGEDWKRYKTLFRPMFDSSMTPDYYKIITGLVEDELNHQSCPEVDFAELFKILAARVIGACAFGNRFDDPEDAKRVAQANTAMFGETAKYMTTIAAQLPALRLIPTAQKRRAMDAAEECRNIVGDLIDDRENGDSSPGTTQPDFAQNVINGMKSGVVTRKEALDNSSLLVVAGHETTAYTMSWMAAIFATNDEIYKKCREEVRRIMGDNRVATLEQIKQMHYLMATKTETLRLFPPIAFIERLCKVPFKIADGVVLRPGTSLTVDVFSIHHDQRLWEEPDVAKPQRHLDQDTGKFKAPEAFKFMPFSGGPRQCPGQNFATREIMLVWSFILRNFDIEWSSDQDFSMLLGITIAPKNPIKGRIQPIAE